MTAGRTVTYRERREFSWHSIWSKKQMVLWQEGVLEEPRLWGEKQTFPLAVGNVHKAQRAIINDQAPEVKVSQRLNWYWLQMMAFWVSHQPRLYPRAGKVDSMRDNEHLSLLALPYSPFLYSVPHHKPHNHIRYLFLVYGVSTPSRPAPSSVLPWQFCSD